MINDVQKKSRHSNDEEGIDLEKTLESIRSYPQAAPCAPTRHGRKRRCTAILTEPEAMQKLSNEQKIFKEKKIKISQDCT